jgi:hypothetical protein
MRRTVLLAAGLLGGMSSLATASIHLWSDGVTDVGGGWDLYSFYAFKFPDDQRPNGDHRPVRSVHILGENYHGALFRMEDRIQLVAPDGWTATFHPGTLHERFSYNWFIDEGTWEEGEVHGFGILYNSGLRPGSQTDDVVRRPVLWYTPHWESPESEYPDFENATGIGGGVFVPIPEPGVLSLLALGGLGVVHRRRN